MRRLLDAKLVYYGLDDGHAHAALGRQRIVYIIIDDASLGSIRVKLNRLDDSEAASSRKVALPRFTFDASGRLAVTVQPMAAMIKSVAA